MKTTLGGKKLGDENILPEVGWEDPKRTKKDLSMTMRFSATGGTLNPCYLEEAQTNDIWHIKAHNLTRTIPTVGPVFGTLKEQIDYFFIPKRLYTAMLHNNPNDFDPDKVYYPTITLSSEVIGNIIQEGTIPAETPRNYLKLGQEINEEQVNPSSWWHRVGVSGLGSPWPQNSTSSMQTMEVTAIPLLGYWDIFKNYYANKQEKNFPILLNLDDVDGTEPVQIGKIQLKAIDWIKNTLLTQPTNTNASLNAIARQPGASQENAQQLIYTYTSAETQGKGLILKTLLSDKLQTWLNSDYVDEIINSTKVLASTDFTIPNFILAEKMYKMANKTLVAGSRWTDYLEAQYGSSVRMQEEQPIWIGSVSNTIRFEEVVSTAATTEEPLGSLAGRGSSRALGENIGTFKANEPGYIMGIYSATPRVDYSQGNRALFRRTMGSDEHVPALDAIGFEDLIAEEMAAWTTLVQIGYDIPEEEERVYRTVGKQPAWTDWTTTYNRTSGEFAKKNSQMFMTFNRKYYNSLEGIQGKPPITEGNLTNANITSYADPAIVNAVFADTERTNEPLWVQVSTEAEVERAMSNQVMPTI